MSAPAFRGAFDGPRRLLLAGALGTLAGCGTAPPARAPASDPLPRTAPAPADSSPASGPGRAGQRQAPDKAGAEQRTALAEALATEQRWLQSWFKGTPVLIAQRGDGTLAVDVPREFCFDAGGSGVKPALAAVLDKVAQSLRRRPAAHVAVLAAPGDAGGSPALALQRAAQVHRHLRERGVPAARLASPEATRAAAVQLRIGLPLD